MELLIAQAKPFQGYISKRVLLRRTVAKIVGVEVRGQAVCFVGRKADSEQKFLVPLRSLLEHLVEDDAQPSEVLASTSGLAAGCPSGSAEMSSVGR